jgi:hypothetical protein
MKRIALIAALVGAAMALPAPYAGATASSQGSCIAQHNSVEASSNPGELSGEVREFAGPGFGGAISEIARAPRDQCPPE